MGSKAKNLFKLYNSGFNVPILKSLETGLKKEDIDAFVDENFKNNPLFAVRSSASVEDGENKSFAGHFYSEIGVDKKDVFQAYKKVEESFNDIEGEVIIQEFIPSDIGGVIFTNEGNGLLIINACQGLCKTVVEGEACDEYFVGKNAKVLSKYIDKNKKPLVYSNGLVREQINSKESLSEKQIEVLVKQAQKIEELFNKAQDIEWCFYNDELYILQSRPITSFPNKRDWAFYDSANIAESYSGIVLPLTQSFAINIYKDVYENLLTASGVPKRKIKDNQEVFNNMVSIFYGRMYYNMNSWYLMMSFLPGYQRNKKNLEDMLSMNINQELSQRIKPSLPLKLIYPYIVGAKMSVFSITINRFKNKVKWYVAKYRNENIENFSLNECKEHYLLLNDKLLQKFHIPVENDVLMMTYLGMLKKKYSDDELQSMLSFDNISSKQINEIAALSKYLFSIDELKKTITNKDNKLFSQLLEEYPEAQTRIKKYFEVYGGRFANELKLESADIEYDTEMFFSMMLAYSNYQCISENTQINNKSSFALRKFTKYAKQREETRLLRSNCFSIVRRIFRRIGQVFVDKKIIKQMSDVFYLTIDEVFDAYNNLDKSLVDLIEKRKEEYKEYKEINPPSFFTMVKGGQMILPDTEIVNNNNSLQGRSCTSGIVRGKIRVFKEFELLDVSDFDIMVAKNTDPGWTSLIGLSKGIIVENGGILSHAAIVSREMKIPTVIGVANVTNILKNGQIVEINGDTGEIKIIE